MFVRNVKYPLLGALLLLLGLPPAVSAIAAEQAGPEAAATRFVTLIDDGDMAAAWREFTPIARAVKNEMQWQHLHKTLRTAYGPVQKRTLRGVTRQERYPMLPDGQYAIVQFDTVFLNKRATVSTVVLVLAEDGRWLVHDYIIS